MIHRLIQRPFFQRFLSRKNQKIRSTQRDRIHLWITSGLTAVMGVVNLISAVSPSLPERRVWLEPFFPFYVRAGGHLFTAVSGFVLLTLAANLLRRKQVAWTITVILLALSIVVHLAKGLDYEESLLAGFILTQLLWIRSIFTARSDRPSVVQGLQVFMAAIVFTLAYGTIGFYCLDGRFQIDGVPINFSFTQAIWQTLAMFFVEDNAGLQPQRHFATYFADSIYIVGASTISASLLLLLRPVLLRGDPATIADRQRARQIIDQYGQTSLARLSLLKDKSYFFSPQGLSVIAYVAKGRAAIALGDPMGPQEDRVEAIQSFDQFCDRNDWFPAFYETLPEELPRYHALGFRSLQIGEEAVVDLKSFNLKGKANQNLRTAVNRLTRTGHTTKIYAPPISEELLLQLKPVSDEWLKSKQGAEKRFSIGWFDGDYLRDCYIGVVYNEYGNVIAFVNLISGYNQAQVTVDLMRHRLDLEKGLMDYLFVNLLIYFQESGLESFSFSLSPLAGVGTTTQSKQIEKGLGYFFNHLNQFYNFKGLHGFKEKFRPQWQPRYLIYPNLSSLPDIAVGLVRADSGDRLLDYFKP